MPNAILRGKYHKKRKKEGVEISSKSQKGLSNLSVNVIRLTMFFLFFKERQKPEMGLKDKIINDGRRQNKLL